MTAFVTFDPLLPWPIIAALAVMLLAGIVLAVLRRLAGWPLRLLAGLVIVGALMDPVYQREEREQLSDIESINDSVAWQLSADEVCKRRKQIDRCGNFVASCPSWDDARPSHDTWHSHATFIR